MNDAEAQRHLQHLTGALATPVIVIGDEVIAPEPAPSHAFDKARLKALLAIV